jgi:[ribosomal protein S18]-alanine N-acetyltransferase
MSNDNILRSLYFYIMKTIFRKIQESDYPFLREMLYEAIYIPEGEKPLPNSTIDTPELSKYIDNWGRFGDIGLLALIDNKPAGAIWSRLYSEDRKGYGYIDDVTPELSMAVSDGFRYHGIGTKLLIMFFDLAKKHEFKALSLSVDKRNRACNLYKRLGFEIVEEFETAYTMKKEL